MAALRLLIERQTRELSVQLTRIAQRQADIDLIRAAWSRLRPARPLSRDRVYIRPLAREKGKRLGDFLHPTLPILAGFAERARGIKFA